MYGFRSRCGFCAQYHGEQGFAALVDRQTFGLHIEAKIAAHQSAVEFFGKIVRLQPLVVEFRRRLSVIGFFKAFRQPIHVMDKFMPQAIAHLCAPGSLCVPR